MRIDLALKEQLNISRSKARALIEEGRVTVNGVAVLKPAFEVSTEDSLRAEALASDILKYVSRGGLKLEKALDSFNISVRDKVCMDIGASTGGFTDCLLQRNAKLVYAVDVGSSQLADKLKGDKRVISMENTDIRSLTLDRAAVDFICVDVSFISVKKVLDRAYAHLAPNGSAAALIKPQFEAGRQNIGKGGIVKNTKVHKSVINDVIEFSRQIGFFVSGLTYSPIKGGDGNTEYLLYLTKEKVNTPYFNIDLVISEAAESCGR